MWLSGVCGPHVPVCIPKEIWAYSSGECALGLRCEENRISQFWCSLLRMRVELYGLGL